VLVAGFKVVLLIVLENNAEVMVAVELVVVMVEDVLLTILVMQ
jgi:hypothetical protein